MVAIFLKRVANAWIEDSDILFFAICAPEWVLSRERTTSTNGHPWRAFEDNDRNIDAKNFFHTVNQAIAWVEPLFEGVHTGVGKVEVVNSLNRADKFSSELRGDEHGWVDVREALLEVPNSFRNNAASVSSYGALVCPVVSCVNCSESSVNSRGWSSDKAVDNFVPEVNFTTKFISTARKRVLASEELGGPEGFVFVAHTNTVSIFAVEAEAKLLEGW